MEYSRKEFLKKLGLLSAGTLAVPSVITSCSSKKATNDLFFEISLAEWSLHKPLFEGKIDNLQFPEIAKNKFGIHAVEYVNQFFKDKAKDKTYLDELNKRCSDLGVQQVLIMVDGEGALASTDDKKRQQAIQNHHKWVKAAQYLGCHAIRVNLRGSGSWEDAATASVDSLGKLATFAKDYDIEVIVENHGGYTSDGGWLADVIRQVDMQNCGTLPDFGNFCIKSGKNGCIKQYNRYKGVKQMMPFAKGVSAKSYDFNKKGFETTIDYERMLKIVKKAGYTGHIGIEYEGTRLSPEEGIKATKNLLVKLGQKIS